MWFECNECEFQTNSPRQAAVHQDDTGHKGSTEYSE